MQQIQIKSGVSSNKIFTSVFASPVSFNFVDYISYDEQSLAVLSQASLICIIIVYPSRSQHILCIQRLQSIT